MRKTFAVLFSSVLMMACMAIGAVAATYTPPDIALTLPVMFMLGGAGLALPVLAAAAVTGKLRFWLGLCLFAIGLSASAWMFGPLEVGLAAFVLLGVFHFIGAGSGGLALADPYAHLQRSGHTAQAKLTWHRARHSDLRRRKGAGIGSAA